MKKLCYLAFLLPLFLAAPSEAQTARKAELVNSPDGKSQLEGLLPEKL